MRGVRKHGYWERMRLASELREGGEGLEGRSESGEEVRVVRE